MKPLTILMLKVLFDMHEGRGSHFVDCTKRGQMAGRQSTLRGLRERRLVLWHGGYAYSLTDSGKEIMVQLAPLMSHKESVATGCRRPGKNSLLGMLRGLLRKKPVKP